MTALDKSFRAFIMEQFPLIFSQVIFVWQQGEFSDNCELLIKALDNKLCLNYESNFETTPFINAQSRFNTAKQELFLSIRGFYERERIKNSLITKEKKSILQGMILTRAVDNQLKQMFFSGAIKYNEKVFQGKGFRSLGQEAIYAGALRLKKDDLIAPVIRDLGMILAFTDDVELVLNAQAGKVGLPCFGKDLHVGNLQKGVLPPAAPLAISSCTATGMALAMKLLKTSRVAISFIGEGGSSLGEWHESINFAAALNLPIVFCLENNQTALSTPVYQQSKNRVFGDKAVGYGLPHVSIDGTDPEAIAAGFAWAANEARLGHGPTLIELISMRLCGHAHHDDMLYIGKEPELSFEIPPIKLGGYVNAELYEKWSGRDPIKCYAQKLIKEKICSQEDILNYQHQALSRCSLALQNIQNRSWPSEEEAGKGVYTNDTYEHHLFLRDEENNVAKLNTIVEMEFAPPFDSKGQTFLEGICLGVRDVLTSRSDTYILGEDVGPPYGNAFMVFKTLMSQFGHRFINTPIAENAIIGACVGMALEGLRPLGEMQFNDFVASGFNQLVNNAAKIHYRINTAVPMVLRMPWGGLRHAGPYHSQDTSAWFYRVPGLKIVVPSTPYDARALLNAAVQDDNPVLFYEHINLYRDPSLRQILGEAPGIIPLGKAAFRRLGLDLSIITYGAYVHKALWLAETLAEEEGIAVDVVDLRSLAPLDFTAIFATSKRTGRVLLFGEDSNRGSILESIAAEISSKAFAYLDAPVRVIGSLNTPVPYAPTLETGYLISNEYLLQTARELLEW